jgi:hypothetical protein
MGQATLIYWCSERTKSFLVEHGVPADHSN